VSGYIGPGIIKNFDKDLHAETGAYHKLDKLITRVKAGGPIASWDKLRKRYPRVTSLLTPKELKQAVNSRDPHTVL
jgi:hypothetical protein